VTRRVLQEAFYITEDTDRCMFIQQHLPFPATACYPQIRYELFYTQEAFRQTSLHSVGPHLSCSSSLLNFSDSAGPYLASSANNRQDNQLSFHPPLGLDSSLTKPSITNILSQLQHHRAIVPVKCRFKYATPWNCLSDYSVCIDEEAGSEHMHAQGKAPRAKKILITQYNKIPQCLQSDYSTILERASGARSVEIYT
jgi:hypothetical protein